MPTLVTCANPDPKGAIASASFQTFSHFGHALHGVSGGCRGDGGQAVPGGREHAELRLAGPEPMGEISWNHSEQHTLKYSVAQMASGMVPYDVAAGRMFCIQLPGGGENIIWTQNYGHLLVVAKGDVSHEQVWLWFVAVHHNVAFAGAPAHAGYVRAGRRWRARDTAWLPWIAGMHGSTAFPTKLVRILDYRQLSM